MKTYNPEKPLIVIHIPKAAGTSSGEVFNSWYNDNFHTHYYNGPQGQMPEQINIFELHTKQRPLCLHGHFNKHRGFGVEDYYPDADQFVTILRDPFELQISHYFYVKKIGHTWADQSRVPKTDLTSYLKESKINMLNHFPRDINRGNYKEICEQYFIEIGITEQLNDSLDRIAKKLGFTHNGMVPELNKTDRDADIPHDFKEQFMELNELEYLVYNYALEQHKTT